jgi:hypothetical protein
MAAAKFAIKSAFIPLFKGGIYSVDFKPLFGKACPEPSRREGEGEIFLFLI